MLGCMSIVKLLRNYREERSLFLKKQVTYLSFLSNLTTRKCLEKAKIAHYVVAVMLAFVEYYL